MKIVDIESVLTRNPIVYVDLKADPYMFPTALRFVRRHDLTKEECKRRGVRFLPKQVMRPIFENNGVN